MVIKTVPLHFDRDEFLTPFDRMFDKLVNNQFPNFAQEVGISFEQGAFPKVDVVDYDDTIVIHAEIPSLKKEALKIDVEDDILTISGDKHQTSSEGRYIRRELKHSSFKRSFRLGELLNKDEISAVFNDGILQIEITKRNPEKPKKTNIDIY